MGVVFFRSKCIVFDDSKSFYLISIKQIYKQTSEVGHFKQKKMVENNSFFKIKTHTVEWRNFSTFLMSGLFATI